MAKSRRFRYLGSKVASFIIITLLFSGLGFYLVGRAQGWFEEKLTIQTLLSLPADSTLGLTKGAEVQIFGSTVGSVADVTFGGMEPNGTVKLYLTLIIRGKKFIAFVREDSQVILREGLTGNAYVQLTAGTGRPAQNSVQLPGYFAPGFVTRLGEILREAPVQEILADIKALTKGLAAGEGDIGRLLNNTSLTDKLDRVLTHFDELLSNLDAAAANIKQASGNLEPISADLRKTTRTLREEISDFRGFAAQLRQSTVQLDSTLQEVKYLAAQSAKQTKDLPATLLKQVEDLPSLLLQLQELMRQMTKLVEAAQKTWLLRGYIEHDEIKRLSPTEVTAP